MIAAKEPPTPFGKNSHGEQPNEYGAIGGENGGSAGANLHGSLHRSAKRGGGEVPANDWRGFGGRDSIIQKNIISRGPFGV